MRGRILAGSILLWTGCAVDASLPEEISAQTVNASSFFDKLIVGYQGWFAAAGDGAPTGEWVHWSRGTTPSRGNVTFELYPDVREYDPADLYATSLANLGNGGPARLFTSHSQRVVDLHFRWMRDYGIDGAALQRFIVTLEDSRHRQFRNDLARMVRRAAEAHGRVFYVEYDVSGARDDRWVQQLEDDWSNTMRGDLDITASPQYLREGGRPVVAVWGFGFPDRPGNPAQAVEVIDWFKSRGCFVVGGVPYGWRTGGGTKPGFMDAFLRLDVIQPWAVGAMASDADADRHHSQVVLPDRDFARSRGVGYQRVIFPGFAWSNWNGGWPNQIPRRAGRMLWRQAYSVRRAGLSAFVAMFDEYDEGTAIAKAAEDRGAIPTDQYFLTLDADGVRLSSDFYLRLAGAAARMIKGQSPAVGEVPIPPFESPPPPSGGDGVPRQEAAPASTVRTFDLDQAGRIVERLYRAVFAREVDPSGRGAYTPLVQQGSLPKVVTALVTSGEFEQRRPSLVATFWAEDFYGAILDRPSDPGGLEATRDAIRAGRGGARLVDMILSPEYASKSL